MLEFLELIRADPTKGDVPKYLKGLEQDLKNLRLFNQGADALAGPGKTMAGKSLAELEKMGDEYLKSDKGKLRTNRWMLRNGSVNMRVLIMLGATQVTVGAATYFYGEYTSVGEEGGMKLATRVGLGRKLQLFGAEGLLPAGTSFVLKRQGGPDWHVLMKKERGQWWITVWHEEGNKVVWDIEAGQVPAYHTPVEGSDHDWDEIDMTPDQLDALMRRLNVAAEAGPDVDMALCLADERGWDPERVLDLLSAGFDLSSLAVLTDEEFSELFQDP